MCKSNNYVQFHSYTGYTALQWFKSHLEWKKVLLKNPYLFFYVQSNILQTVISVIAAFQKNG